MRAWIVIAWLWMPCIAVHAAGGGSVPAALLDVEINPKRAVALALPRVDLGSPDAMLEANLVVARASAALGDREAVARHVERARGLAPSTTDPGLALALTHAVQGESAIDAGQVPACRTSADGTLRHAATVKDELSSAFLRELAAWVLSVCLRRYIEAEPHFMAALATYEARGLVLRTAMTRSGIANIHEGLHDAKATLNERQRAFALLAKVDAPYAKSYLAWASGQSALNMDDLDLAVRYYTQSLVSAREMQDDTSIATAEQGMGMARVRQRHYAEGLALLERTQPRVLAAGYGDLWASGNADMALALAHLGHGDPEALLAAAKAKLAGMPDGAHKIKVHRTEAEVLVALGKPTQAVAALTQAMRIQQSLFVAAGRAQVAALVVRYDLDRKQSELNNLHLQAELADTGQRYLLALLALAGVLLASIGWILRTQVAQRKHFAHLALTDSLTGAPNRRAILDHLAQVTARHGVATVAILDIDHFKRVNDRFGHDVGDRVLRAFWTAAQACLRPCETIGRTGGEEWLVVIDEPMDAAGVQDLFDRFRRQLHAMAIDGLPDGEKVTFSMGAATAHPGAPSLALTAADAALYRAKTGGRDRCEALQG